MRPAPDERSPGAGRMDRYATVSVTLLLAYDTVNL
jgi:hypothetical protein